MYVTSKSLVGRILPPILAIVLAACGVAAPPTDPPAPTDLPPTVAPPTASLTAVPPTATLTAVPPTETPVPTATPDLDAIEATSVAATEAPILAMIDAELRHYDLSTEEGHLGWLHDPYSVDLADYMSEDIHTDFPDVTASDFVLQADITWNTTTGVAGCGLVARAAPDFDHGDAYRLNLARFGPLWDLEYYEAGKFYSNLTGLRDAGPLDAGVNSTNTLTLVALGNKLGVYANYQEMDTITDIHLTQGASAFLTWQESGKTTCTFENAWMWVLKD